MLLNFFNSFFNFCNRDQYPREITYQFSIFNFIDPSFQILFNYYFTFNFFLRINFSTTFLFYSHNSLFYIHSYNALYILYFPLNISLLPILYFLFFPSYKSFIFIFILIPPFSFSLLLLFFHTTFTSRAPHLLNFTIQFLKLLYPPFSLLYFLLFLKYYSILHSLPTSSLFPSFLLPF